MQQLVNQIGCPILSASIAGEHERGISIPPDFGVATTDGPGKAEIHFAPFTEHNCCYSGTLSKVSNRVLNLHISQTVCIAQGFVDRGIDVSLTGTVVANDCGFQWRRP